MKGAESDFHKWSRRLALATSLLSGVSGTGQAVRRRCVGKLLSLTASFAVMTIVVFAAESRPVIAEPLQADFRGCESAGWCKFRIESLDPLAKSLYRVYPDGVVQTPGNAETSIAIRDRLNALLASMVHQHKRIVLYDLRECGDGAYAAIVTVNEANVAEDLLLQGLQENVPGASAGKAGCSGG